MRTFVPGARNPKDTGKSGEPGEKGRAKKGVPNPYMEKNRSVSFKLFHKIKMSKHFKSIRRA
jgi:hypothetical protein